MELLEFFKISASGNDFVLIDNRDAVVDKKFPDLAEFARKVCRRRISVGADGLILIERSKTCDFSWQFFNADGSTAEMCGNGGRCAARFAYLQGIASERMSFETLAGVVRAQVKGAKVKLQLTQPTNMKLDYPITLEKSEIFVSSVNTGVPHVILITDNLDRVPVEELGRSVRYHKTFSPSGTNVDFVTVIDKENAKIRTYERGVEGETFACGTGAVAAGVILREKGLTGDSVNIWTRGGEVLQVYLNDNVYLEGGARVVYRGTLWDEATE
jgi:diaminopimelate epimerase